MNINHIKNDVPSSGQINSNMLRTSYYPLPKINSSLLFNSSGGEPYSASTPTQLHSQSQVQQAPAQTVSPPNTTIQTNASYMQQPNSYQQMLRPALYTNSPQGVPTQAGVQSQQAQQSHQAQQQQQSQQQSQQQQQQQQQQLQQQQQQQQLQQQLQQQQQQQHMTMVPNVQPILQQSKPLIPSSSLYNIQNIPNTINLPISSKLNDGEIINENGHLIGKSGKPLRNTKRAAQNRNAQKAFRQRKEKYIKKLEYKAKNFDQLAMENESLKLEVGKLQEIIKKLQEAISNR